MAGRPLGSTTKLQKSWVYDQLVERNFNVLDEAIGLFALAETTSAKVEILRTLMEYALPKPRPVDADGLAESPVFMAGAALSDEKLVMLVQVANSKAKEKKEA